MGVSALIRALGQALLLLALLMAVPFIYASTTDDAAAGSPFLFGTIATLIGGAGLVLASGRSRPRVDFRGGLLLITLWWTIAPLFAAIPIMMAGYGPFDAYFEAVSALTTTGAWLDPAAVRADAPGLLWRALLQWFGGLTSIAIAAAIIVRPIFFGLETLQLPFSRGERDSYLRSLKNAMKAFAGLYAVLTFAAFAALAFAGVDDFEATIMALSVVASGGLVPGSGAIADYPLAARLVMVPFMVIAAANFIVLSFAARGGILAVRDREIQVFGGMIIAVAALFWLLAGAGDIDLIVNQIFNAASLMGTNGVLIGEAPPFAVAAVAVLIGGCSVSTAGGIKVLRWLVIFRRAREEIRGLISPNEVQRRAVIADEFGVWIHFLVFTLLLGAVVLFVTLDGQSFQTAAAGAAAALSNTGPLFVYASSSTVTAGVVPGFDVFSPSLRMILAAVMILGRIEAVAILALFNPAFWRS